MGNDTYKLISGATKSAVANKASRLGLKCVTKNTPKQVNIINKRIRSLITFPTLK